MARQEANEQFQITSFLDGANAAYIEQLYARYEDDPSSVSDEWRSFFKALDDSPDDVKKAAKGASWQRKNWPIQANGELVSALDGNWGVVEKVIETKVKAKAEAAGKPTDTSDILQATRDSVRAIMMIRAYRMRGHLHAKLDPLGIAAAVEDYKELSPEAYGFTEADLDRKIFIDNVLGLEYASIREMMEILERTYCSTLGVEFMHISNPEEKAWIQERIEGVDKGIAFSPERKKAILQKVIESEGYEQFLDVKFKGTKRFGLDGGESLIPALEQILKSGSQLGLKEAVFGMAHRGRLNVLSQVMAKPHRAIFHEFKGGSYAPDEVEGSGDVKYHLGASSDRDFDGIKVHVSLTANPSHLEIVNPVVMGKARAKQDMSATVWDGDVIPLSERSKVVPLLIHGDAAFAGQGVVAEILGLSGLRGHRVAGTMHVIINNQIGFTTNPAFSRSSPYPSDVAKMIEAPIFHVNGDDPEAVVYAAKIATEFRMKFHKPVVLDLFCYRRYGHNEGDEPSFTQPKMYKVIRAHKTVLQLYSERLVAEGVLSEGEVEKMKADWRAHLEQEFEAGQSYKPNKADWLDGEWSGLHTADNADEQRRGKTGRADEDAEGHRPEAVGNSGRLPCASYHPALHGKPRQHGADRRRHRLGNGGSARFRLARRRGPQDPSVRPGLRTRHLLAASFGSLRSGNRRALHPARQPVADPGSLRGHQLDALGRGGSRLRIRLLAGSSECADALGSSVRRLRKRCAGRLRPVHLVGRTQVAAHVRSRLPAAAWL